MAVPGFARLVLRLPALLMIAGALSGCGLFGSSGNSGEIIGPPAPIASEFLGSVAADDPQVVGVGRDLLVANGTAADAAVGMALTLAVSLPSRAGIDGGGVCLVHEGDKQPVEEIDFLPSPVAGSRFPVPGLIRGLVLLQARHGHLRWEQAVSRAEALASLGITVTPQLLADLTAAGLGLTNAAGQALKPGDILPQQGIAQLLARLRVAKPSELYDGALGRELAASGVDGKALAAYVPVLRQADPVSIGGQVQLWTSQGAGGIAAHALLQDLAQGKPGDAASLRQSLVKSVPLDQSSASTGFVVTDSYGDAVACTLTMGKLFGTRQIIEALGVFAAAPLSATAEQGLVPLLATKAENGEIIAAFAGAGSSSAAADTLQGVWSSLTKGVPVDQALAAPRGADESTVTPAPGRVNAIVCPAGLVAAPDRCVAARDPRGNGFAQKIDQLNN